MNKKLQLIGGVMLLVGGLVQAQVTVHYESPEKYIDIIENDRSEAKSIAFIKQELDAFFRSDGQKMLKKGHSLTITFLDIDRAGDIDYALSVHHRPIRVLKDTARIRIKFSYTLNDENNKVIKSDEVELKEFISLSDSRMRNASRENMFYEKEVLRDWLKKLY